MFLIEKRFLSHTEIYNRKKKINFSHNEEIITVHRDNVSCGMGVLYVHCRRVNSDDDDEEAHTGRRR